MAARDGLVLVRHKAQELRIIPPAGPDLIVGGHHVLLVGDGGVGHHQARPFQVVKARLVLEPKQRRRRLQVQTFSSELGTWGPCTEIRTPQIHGKPRQGDDNPLRAQPLVAGGAVHWLCFTDEEGFVLKLRVRAAAPPPRLTVTKLAESFPYKGRWNLRRLMATVDAGGSPAVLVADGESSKISAWRQSKHTARWGEQPQVVIEYETIARSLAGEDMGGLQSWQWPREQVPMEWFAERSGAVLIRVRDRYFSWLDLQSRKIVRCSSDSSIRYKTMYYPCEMDLSTRAPTFSSSL
ncbi:hypothetical protein PVAP13_2KG574600 [Panicum virgatum]|uniref:DUF7595 domain-containing protein n=1 Tax=Panicum virgatum TaxID=38727 RepID=A0A8T0WJ57_PANVG|nr:hypothetical protein PVAP13_2KG574600 [Panicum virgatum]